MAIDFDSSYIQSLSAQTKAASVAENVSGSLSSVNNASSREEMESAVKEFEKFFVEKMLEQVEESMKSEEEGTDTCQGWKEKGRSWFNQFVEFVKKSLEEE